MILGISENSNDKTLCNKWEADSNILWKNCEQSGRFDQCEIVMDIAKNEGDLSRVKGNYAAKVLKNSNYFMLALFKLRILEKSSQNTM